MSFRNLLIAGAVIATGFAAGLAVAQPAPQAMPHGAMQHGSMHGSDTRPTPARFVEGRIAFLQAELKLTAAQQPLFAKVADEIRASAKAMEARHTARREQAAAQSAPAPGAVERLEQRQAAMTEIVAAQGRFIAALKPLYASLTDEQRQTADLLFSRGSAAGMPGGKGRHRHH